MDTPKIYCDHGSITRQLRELESQKRVVLIEFPYDGDKCKKTQMAYPSKAQIRDLQMPIKELPGTFGDYASSEQYSKIEQILDKNNRRDILHVDSAFKAGCSYFFSMDKKHILARGEELYQTLGIRFFHPLEEWDNFIVDLNKNFSTSTNDDKVFIRKLIITVFIITILQLNGCAFLLIGAGIGAVGKATEASNAKNKQIELEAKKEYGKYRLEMQQNNSEPILTYEEWLTEQVKDPEKAKQWKKLLINIEKQNNKKSRFNL